MKNVMIALVGMLVAIGSAAAEEQDGVTFFFDTVMPRGRCGKQRFAMLPMLW